MDVCVHNLNYLLYNFHSRAGISFHCIVILCLRTEEWCLQGGCGDTNGKPQIDKTPHLQKAYEYSNFKLPYDGKKNDKIDGK